MGAKVSPKGHFRASAALFVQSNIRASKNKKGRPEAPPREAKIRLQN
jgi:hypothetical protein